MSDYAAYWACDPADAPALTGAASVMDCSDLREVVNALDITLWSKSVLDVGCGTGRFAHLCDRDIYNGCDVSPGMVEFATRTGLYARVFSGPGDLEKVSTRDDFIACLSVFTHISRDDRQAYLTAFARIAPELLVDIIPGNGEGTIAHWTAHPGDFRHDLTTLGWAIQGEYGRTAPDGTTHLYFHCRRAS